MKFTIGSGTDTVTVVESPPSGDKISIYAKGSGKITPFGSFVSTVSGPEDVVSLGNEVILTGAIDTLATEIDNKFPYIVFVSTMAVQAETDVVYPDISPLSNIHPADSQGQDGTNWEWLPGALEFGGVTFDNLDPPPPMGYPLTFLLQAPSEGQYFTLTEDTEFIVYYHHSEGSKVRFLLGGGTIDQALITAANQYFSDHGGDNGFAWDHYEIPATLLSIGGVGAPGESVDVYINSYGEGQQSLPPGQPHGNAHKVGIHTGINIEVAAG